jgi:hypothetical protein
MKVENSDQTLLEKSTRRGRPVLLLHRKDPSENGVWIVKQKTSEGIQLTRQNDSNCELIVKNEESCTCLEK